MVIHIETLTLNIIIGLLDFERETPQRVIVDMRAEYDYTPGHFVDYADIVTLVRKEMEEKEYQLLEEALLDLQACIISAYPQIEKLTLKITKPDILSHCSVALSQTWVF